jgi:NAD(P)-dependent dehydrogenase (short-subunit alcohol dehydrogenase family)
MRAALAHMRAQDYGRIVNTSSALAAFSSPGSAGYTTAKAAILALSKSASLDNEDRDIRVNAILPVALTGRSANFFAKNPDLESARMSTGQVSPVVMYLCHHSCALNGEALAAAAGRVARVFSATVPGYYSDKLTDEEVVANLETIMDTRQFHILRTSLEQHKLLPPLSGEAAGR